MRKNVDRQRNSSKKYMLIELIIYEFTIARHNLKILKSWKINVRNDFISRIILSNENIIHI